MTLNCDTLQKIFNKQRSLYHDEFQYLTEHINDVVYRLCKDGKLDIVKWLYYLSRGEKKSIEKLESFLVKSDSPKKIKLDYEFKKVVFTDSTFCNCCFDGQTEVAKWIYKMSKYDTKININYYEDRPFYSACENNKIDTAMWLYELSETDGNTKINIKSRDQYAFGQCCIKGNKQLVEWIYDTAKEANDNINLHKFDCIDFRYSCYYGQLEIAQYLLKKSQEDCDKPIDIRSDNDFAFKKACYYNQIEVALWLCTLCPSYSVKVYDKTVYDFTDGKNEKKKQQRIKYYKIDDDKFIDFSSSNEFDDFLSFVYGFFNRK
jgi:hypothetical protein